MLLCKGFADHDNNIVNFVTKKKKFIICYKIEI